ncbi:phosphate ABC transporter permease subunit PstC [Methanolobus psychrotolerans]|uniref:phosphate ABC transporter permease subunit PstC n=1 Tax=Methanolobus psychrotolerans TaxID=1874706 RepID=UPI001F5DCD2E|nr:phosphate ABC transporter permease subunit PstC [Methanolobus psychrotolerans]
MTLSRSESSAPKYLFTFCTLLTAFITFFFIGFIFYIAYPTFESQGVINFITGSVWNYDEHVYGIRIYLLGTLILTVVTLALSVPVGLFTAIFLSEFASPRVASIVKPLIELLVGIPSVVYGIFGFLVLGPIFVNYVSPLTVSLLGFIPFFSSGVGVLGMSLALAATVLAIMILPTIISISEDSIRSVESTYREASFSLGATHWETISKVLLPAASRGILAAVVLGMMRAMGETMAVVMLFGSANNIPTTFFGTGTALTSKILSDVSFKIANEEARSAIFAVAAVLFAIEILFVGLARAIGGRND